MFARSVTLGKVTLMSKARGARMIMAKLTGQAFGNGATIDVDGDKLTIHVDIGKKARDAAPLSGSGKNRLVANSGGWQMVPGTDLRMNLGVMFKDAK